MGRTRALHAESDRAMSVRTRADRRQGSLTEQAVQRALTECPPPWVPIEASQDASYRRVVEAYGSTLREQAETRAGIRTWLLIRYLPDVPSAMVDRALASLRRELVEFCELAGGTPDFVAAEAWAARWRAAHDDGIRRRAAS